MRRPGRLEVPLDSFLLKKVVGFGRSVQLLYCLPQLSLGSDEICTIVGKHVNWLAVQADEAAHDEQEIVGRK